MDLDSMLGWRLLEQLHRLVTSPKEILGPIVDRLDANMREVIEEDPFQRDPEAVAASLPMLRAINAYFGVDFRGWEDVPKGEPVLIVANHSGGMMPVDPIPLLLRWYEARGCESPIYGLGHNFLFSLPNVGPKLRSLGVLPASHRNAQRALEKGDSVIVFPGGDYEACRTWGERNRICFGGRMGFIELAIRTGVRVVPMTIHGAHESTFILTRGKDLARKAGLDRLRVKVFPISWSIPFGLVPAFVPSIPLPSKLTIQIEQPLDWSHHGEANCEDPAILQACYDEITSRMQSSLDVMSRERPHPILTRLNELRPSRAIAGMFGG